MNKFTLLCLIVALIGVLLVAFLIFGPASAEDCVTMTCQWLTATPTWVTSTPGLPFVPTDPYPAPVTSVPGYPAPQIDEVHSVVLPFVANAFQVKTPRPTPTLRYPTPTWAPTQSPFDTITPTISAITPHPTDDD
jgi:hypothetical protein